jgi:small acid-soluble spore protein B (major beta-type SASP)
MEIAVANMSSPDKLANISDNDFDIIRSPSKKYMSIVDVSVVHNKGATTKQHPEGDIQMSRSRSSNSLVVPQATAALNQMKMEAAQELGIHIPADGYYGNMTSRETGSIGGQMTRNLVQIAQQQLSGTTGPNLKV